MLPVWHYFVNRKWLNVSFCHILSRPVAKLALKISFLGSGTQFENIPAERFKNIKKNKL